MEQMSTECEMDTALDAMFVERSGRGGELVRENERGG